MAVIRKSEILKRYNADQSYLLEESRERLFASGQLKKAFESFSFSEQYDVFLSHSYEDSRVVKQVRDMLQKKGHTVYVDWLEDSHLDRGKVTSSTATVLRNRMKNCSSLLYLTSAAAESSVWMPWELGYMDARTNRVAVAPIFEDDEDEEEFLGREYLGLYPYLDLTSDSFYIQNSSNEWVGFDRWMQGFNPEDH
ncbi:toll/interleukin-1 receptor domain-containing protein [endosymbiont of Lamellibrachia barhami]|uniref:toll/interleukin-1 receptor domain-containing protein n=1 Tax=endosymbiont of Lamellibrachia barhami TaxID=205975 RepID=UPI0015AB415A|nr:toll/interleukin-1 receptor domain-containing protein [endosymbiont of Lamellibrachia barhami]